PGGQHVNTTSSAVQLRFDLRNTRSLPEDVAARLAVLAGSRLTKDGVIVITADGHRSQRMNRDEALARLVELIRSATVRQKARR
ncbi:alternative ribosome rescue aminoacyl-tRNA hydrolase ArfB, partial [Acinetobacter baumannii]